MAEIDASRANSEELCKANEELRKNLQQLDQRSTREWGLSAQLRARPKHSRRRSWMRLYRHTT